MQRLLLAFVLAGAFMSGCASKNPDSTAGEELEVRMGVVDEVRRVPLPSASGGYVGTLGGAGAGGIAGGAVGSGRGSQAASVAGAVAGAVGGRALENSMTAKEGQEIAVRLDSGRVILVLQPDGEVFTPGERVRVISSNRTVRVAH